MEVDYDELLGEGSFGRHTVITAVDVRLLTSHVSQGEYMPEES